MIKARRKIKVIIMEVETLPNYLIYNDGRCFNLLSKKFLRKKMGKKNYYIFDLHNSDNEKISLYVHGLVALHYVPNPNNYNKINHIDENKKNNDKNNLEWVEDDEKKVTKEELRKTVKKRVEEWHRRNK